MGINYRGLETATSLLLSYESLALAHERALDLEKINADNSNREIDKNINYQNSLALLMLNSAIIEGVLRSIISDKISDEINKNTTDGVSQGKTEPSKAEHLLSKYRNDIEMLGGWGKIKEQYLFYFDLSLDIFMEESIKEAINTLFTLRNVLAHGTAIISPKDEMNETNKNNYPFTWKRKLQQTSIYLKKTFGSDDIFENLSEHSMPEHFFLKTQMFMKKIENEFSPLPKRAKVTIDMINEYKFGYVNFTK